MKKSIVLIPLPSLIKNSFVRSFVLWSVVLGQSGTSPSVVCVSGTVTSPSVRGVSGTVTSSSVVCASGTATSPSVIVCFGDT